MYILNRRWFRRGKPARVTWALVAAESVIYACAMKHRNALAPASISASRGNTLLISADVMKADGHTQVSAVAR